MRSHPEKGCLKFIGLALIISLRKTYPAVATVKVRSFPSLVKEGGLRHKEMLRSHRSGADGVVGVKKWFQ